MNGYSFLILFLILSSSSPSQASPYFNFRDAQVINSGEFEGQVQAPPTKTVLAELTYGLSSQIESTLGLGIIGQRHNKEFTAEYLLNGDLRVKLIDTGRFQWALALLPEYSKETDQDPQFLSSVEMPLTLRMGKGVHFIGGRHQYVWESKKSEWSLILGGRVPFASTWGWVYDSYYCQRGLAYNGGLFLALLRSNARVQAQLFSREPGEGLGMG